MSLTELDSSEYNDVRTKNDGINYNEPTCITLDLSFNKHSALLIIFPDILHKKLHKHKLRIPEFVWKCTRVANLVRDADAEPTCLSWRAY